MVSEGDTIRVYANAHIVVVVFVDTGANPFFMKRTADSPSGLGCHENASEKSEVFDDRVDGLLCKSNFIAHNSDGFWLILVPHEPQSRTRGIGRRSMYLSTQTARRVEKRVNQPRLSAGER